MPSNKYRYTERIIAAPEVLDPDINPTLKNTFYRMEDGTLISAYQRLNFLFCRAFQGATLYELVAGWSESPENEPPSDGLKYFLDALPDPDDLAKCLTRILSVFT